MKNKKPKKKKLTTAQAMRQLGREFKEEYGETLTAFKRRKGIR